MFKLQDPKDLISRLYILEYMRDITAAVVYERVNEDQKKSFFYKYEGSDGVVGIDFNWEYALFSANMLELELLMQSVYNEVVTIEERRMVELNRMKEVLEGEKKEEDKKPVDMNLMDFAKASMDASKNKIWT
jgi:hypothetical protein